MRRWAAAAMVVLAVVAGACGGDDGDRLAAVGLTPLSDEPPRTLDQIDGPAVINLWATTCAPCVRELPDFQSVADTRSDVAFYGINIGEDAARAAPFLDQLGVTYPQYLDPQGYVSTELGVTLMPTTIVLDADGEISTEHRGAMDIAALNTAIDVALEN